MATDAEIAAMGRAIELAARGIGSVLPNPVVGCVILDQEGQTIGEGWHRQAGGPHAEIDALTRAGKDVHGSTAVVTLEPCNHTGRTGPCSRALIRAGISRVVIAVPDPWAPASGGIQALRAAGVDVETGVLATEATVVNEPWLTAIQTRRPFVTWKFAATLDGRVAAKDGSSQWITGEEARLDVHRLRAEVDTILAGIGTVLADDPALTVRDANGGLASRQPLRVVADSYGRTPPDAKVLDDSAETWLVTAKDVAAADGRLDLNQLMRLLFDREKRHVLLEGGPTLAGGMIEEGLVDRVVGYLAPALLGAGPNVLGYAGIDTIRDAWRLDPIDVRTVGPDVRLVARPHPRSAPPPPLRANR